MTERLLHFIWQFQYFNKSALTTSTGDAVQIIFAGQYNTNQGPDFLDAKIKIDTTTWAGTVELHVKTSDWKKHYHQTDKNYENVVLHVVWEHDEAHLDSLIPVIELKERVAKILLERYEELMNAVSFIPCEKNISMVRDITWKSWKDRLVIERLLRKTIVVETYLVQNNFHWEETFWWMLAKNFGATVNTSTFEEVAKSISINILAKHKTQIHQVESLLLGQAGLLEQQFHEEYPKLLQKEYRFLKEKYLLKPIHQPVYFLRMRPGNFPTIRLAQLAVLITESAHLFSKIKEAATIKEIKEWFDITANDYWHYHYRLDDPSSFKKKNLGPGMVNNIIINTVAPVLFAYGNYHNENKLKEKALQWLEEIDAEKNAITKGFQLLNIENKNAFDSQALIELKNEFCNNKKCLECGVGNAILKN